MEFSMELHENFNSMEFRETEVDEIPYKFHGKFHGIS
jgi:hypothetical protein